MIDSNKYYGNEISNDDECSVAESDRDGREEVGEGDE